MLFYDSGQADLKFWKAWKAPLVYLESLTSMLDTSNGKPPLTSWKVEVSKLLGSR